MPAMHACEMDNSLEVAALHSLQCMYQKSSPSRQVACHPFFLPSTTDSGMALCRWPYVHWAHNMPDPQLALSCCLALSCPTSPAHSSPFGCLTRFHKTVGCTLLSCCRLQSSLRPLDQAHKMQSLQILFLQAAMATHAARLWALGCAWMD